jgi:hypothetical protein
MQSSALTGRFALITLFSRGLPYSCVWIHASSNVCMRSEPMHAFGDCREWIGYE